MSTPENRRLLLPLSFFFSLGLAVLTLVAILDQPAFSQAEATSKPVKWDYMSQTIDAASLQAKISEVGNEDWEVISIEIAESLLDPMGANGQPRIIVTKYQLTTRRVRR